MRDLPTDVTASTAPVRKAACSVVGFARARLGQLWLDVLAAECGAAPSTLPTYPALLAAAALRLTADTRLEPLTAREQSTDHLPECHVLAGRAVA